MPERRAQQAGGRGKRSGRRSRRRGGGPGVAAGHHPRRLNGVAVDRISRTDLALTDGGHRDHHGVPRGGRSRAGYSSRRQTLWEEEGPPQHEPSRQTCWFRPPSATTTRPAGGSRCQGRRWADGWTCVHGASTLCTLLGYVAGLGDKVLLRCAVGRPHRPAALSTEPSRRKPVDRLCLSHGLTHHPPCPPTPTSSARRLRATRRQR